MVDTIFLNSTALSQMGWQNAYELIYVQSSTKHYTSWGGSGMARFDPNPSVAFLRRGPTLTYDIFVFRFYEAAVRDLRQSATGLSCPSQSAITLMSTPACNRCLVGVWRMVCSETFRVANAG